MSTTPVTPDQSTAVPSSNLGNMVSNPAPAQPTAPAAAQPVQQPRTAQVLQAVASSIGNPPQTPSASSGGVVSTNDDDDDMSSGQRSGWKTNLGKGLSTVAAGLSGVSDKGRPSFFGGLGEGARGEQAAQAAQQEIKFKSFDDQVRMAQLHNQDLKMQNDTQAQTDAHTKADLDNRALANSLGVDYDTIANHGSAVMDHLSAQTEANGAAAVPAGTHLSGDGKTVQIPQDTQQTRDGQKQMYNQLAPALGLPSLPQGAQFVPPKNMNMLTNKIHGFDINGEPLKHDDLPTYISTTQTQRDAMAKNGASDSQLKTLDNMIGIYKANLGALDTHADAVKQSGAQATAAGTLAAQTSPDAVKAEAGKAGAVKQAQLDVENSPANQAAAAKGAGQKSAAEEAAKTGASSNLYVGTDATGNQIAGTSTDLQTAGASGVTKLDADTGKKVITARQLISPAGLFSQINQDMRALDAKGKMGSSATSRINDALLSKAGSDPDYAPLFVHTHLLATALMQAHVGSRGSSDMMEEFKSLANSGKMNAATLRSALGAEYNYVHEKAMLPQKVGQ
jgi:hypothetical protein